MARRRQKPAVAVADLFGGRPEDLALAGDLVRELNRELRHRSWVYPRWIDEKRLSKDEADRRCILLAKAMAHFEALAAYHADRTALVHEVARRMTGGGGRAGEPVAHAMLETADDVLRLVEARLRLGNARLLPANDRAGVPG